MRRLAVALLAPGMNLVEVEAVLGKGKELSTDRNFSRYEWRSGPQRGATVITISFELRTAGGAVLVSQIPLYTIVRSKDIQD